MWYVYREYNDGETVEDCYDTLASARSAKHFMEQHFDADLITMSPQWTISPVGGRLFREPKSSPKITLWSWLAGLFKSKRALSR